MRTNLMLETTQQQAKEQARRAAEATAEQTKAEVGRRAFDTLEEYFPEEAKHRYRERQTAMLVIGFGLGFIFGILLGR